MPTGTLQYPENLLSLVCLLVCLLQVLFHLCGIVVLTLVINATTVAKVLELLGEYGHPLLVIYSCLFIIPDIRAQKRKHALKRHLFMIYERFRGYSHLPHQVANDGINCYDENFGKIPRNSQCLKYCISK